MRTTTGQFTGVDLTGRKVGKLTPLRRDGRDKYGYALWVCQCDCGNQKAISSQVLLKELAGRRGTKTCGCGPVGRPYLPDNWAHVNALIKSYRDSAKNRKACPFELSKNECRRLFDDNCAYCGVVPTVSYTHASLPGKYAWNGIDRVDNSKGYVASNCVSCCSTCNRAKNTTPRDEFLAWVGRVYRHSVAPPVTAISVG